MRTYSLSGAARNTLGGPDDDVCDCCWSPYSGGQADGFAEGFVR
ncbi:Zn-dependent exopeptidase M28, partial [Mycobacterium sp. ITM-2017-0098]